MEEASVQSFASSSCVGQDAQNQALPQGSRSPEHENHTRHYESDILGVNINLADDGEDDPPGSENIDPWGLFERCILTVEQAESLFKLFRSMSDYFPFMILPSNATFQSNAQKKPFMFLAAITAASVGKKSLQRTLDKEFRNVLSQKVILDGEKSIDLLQGLLVYLAWFVMPLAQLGRLREKSNLWATVAGTTFITLLEANKPTSSSRLQSA